MQMWDLVFCQCGHWHWEIGSDKSDNCKACDCKKYRYAEPKEPEENRAERRKRRKNG